MADLLTQKNIADLTDELQRQLGEAAPSYVTDAIAEAAIPAAIRDLNRHYPKQEVYELTITEHVETD